MADMQAIGDQARVINAALPFANGPLHGAQRFVLSGNDLDQRRALLCLTQAVYYEVRLRAAGRPPGGRAGRSQPDAPPGLSQIHLRRRLSGRRHRHLPVHFRLRRRALSPSGRDAWRQAEEVARAALSGYVETSVGEATHYHADYVAPRWAPLLAKVAEIGQHIFYRWPGGWGQPAAFTGHYIGEPRDPLSMRPPMPVAGARPMARSTEPRWRRAGPPVPHAPQTTWAVFLIRLRAGRCTSRARTRAAAPRRKSASQQGAPATPGEVATASAGGATTGSK